MENTFRFSLQKLLEVREGKEEECKRLFSKSQLEKQRTEQRLEELTNSYDKYKGINKGESVVYQKVKKNYLLALEQGITTTTRELKVKEEELELRRRDLLKKQVERKTVDILKEKKYREFKKEQERLEVVSNDEFALYAYIRNFKNGVKS